MNTESNNVYTAQDTKSKKEFMCENVRESMNYGKKEATKNKKK